MVTVREACESDVQGIRDLFMSSYGENYAHPKYYDLHELKKLTFSDSTILLVAEDQSQLLGTASVVLHVGAYNDLVGEFGRLVVSPAARGRGVGQQLMEGRVSRVEPRLHVGLVENRTVHPFSQKISARNGFACAGILPEKLLFQQRESIALYVRHFGNALELRRNHPRVISEAVPLAELSMRNLGLQPDVIADVCAAPYVRDDEFEVEQFNTQGYATLLRLERGRVHHREIVGPLRLHYGLFQLRAKDSVYLVARDGRRLAGAVGFARDPVERTVRIFELISATERPIRFLLEEVLRVCRELGSVDYIEVDVNADAPRMQRTLLELEFSPCAYIPALTFHQVERLDVVKFAHLNHPPDLSTIVAAPPSKQMVDLIAGQFKRTAADPRVLAAADISPLFAGLNADQKSHLSREFSVRAYRQGDKVFTTKEPAEHLYLIVEGGVEITDPVGSRKIATAQAGDCVGERSLITGIEHVYSADAIADTEMAVLSDASIARLVRRRPDIGVILYKNLAQLLARKLA